MHSFFDLLCSSEAFWPTYMRLGATQECLLSTQALTSTAPAFILCMTVHNGSSQANNESQLRVFSHASGSVRMCQGKSAILRSMNVLGQEAQSVLLSLVSIGSWAAPT